MEKLSVICACIIYRLKMYCLDHFSENLAMKIDLETGKNSVVTSG